MKNSIESEFIARMRQHAHDAMESLSAIEINRLMLYKVREEYPPTGTSRTPDGRVKSFGHLAEMKSHLLGIIELIDEIR